MQQSVKSKWYFNNNINNINNINMSETNINQSFIEASRRKLRIATTRGQLSVEDLWDLSLKSLDAIAITLDEQLQKQPRKSFIDTRPKACVELQLAFDITNFVIDTKLAEQDAAKEHADRTAQVAFLKGLLQEKETDALKSLSSEEIKAKLAALGVTA